MVFIMGACVGSEFERPSLAVRRSVIKVSRVIFVTTAMVSLVSVGVTAEVKKSVVRVLDKSDVEIGVLVGFRAWYHIGPSEGSIGHRPDDIVTVRALWL